MTNVIDPLVHDLVEWIAKKPRPYAQVMEAWRKSCPRLTVWEDATERGYVVRRTVAGRGPYVFVTEAGRNFLQSVAKDR